MKTLRTPAHNALVAKLKSARIDAELTQQGLADLLDVPQSWVAKIELRERRIDVIEFVQWLEACDALGHAQSVITDIAKL